MPWISLPPLIGLDVGTGAVKVVQMEQKGGRKYVGHAAKVDIEDSTDEESVRRAILQALKMSGAKGKRVCCSIAGPSTAVRKLALPKMTEDELPGAVWWEGGQVIPYDMENVYFDFQKIGTDDRAARIDVLFVAASKELIDRKQKLIEGCGLEARIFDTDAMALLNGFMSSPSRPLDTERYAVMDIGARYTNLAIAVEGQVPFVRDILIGGDDYTHAIMRELDVSFPEAERIKRRLRFQPNPRAELAMVAMTERLAEEIQLSFRYFQKREEHTSEEFRLENARLCGGASQLVGLEGRLSVLLDMKVETWSPLSDMMEGELIPGLADYQYSFAVALGLALREEPQ
jgi:type IV pilus assembly protein PilM